MASVGMVSFRAYPGRTISNGPLPTPGRRGGAHHRLQDLIGLSLFSWNFCQMESKIGDEGCFSVSGILANFALALPSSSRKCRTRQYSCHRFWSCLQVLTKSANSWSEQSPKRTRRHDSIKLLPPNAFTWSMTSLESRLSSACFSRRDDSSACSSLPAVPPPTAAELSTRFLLSPDGDLLILVSLSSTIIVRTWILPMTISHFSVESPDPRSSGSTRPSSCRIFAWSLASWHRRNPSGCGAAQRNLLPIPPG